MFLDNRWKLRKNMVILWKMFDKNVDGEWRDERYGRRDCIWKRYTHEYCNLYGTQLWFNSWVNFDYGKAYSVCCKVKRDCRIYKFLTKKGFVEF